MIIVNFNFLYLTIVPRIERGDTQASQFVQF